MFGFKWSRKKQRPVSFGVKEIIYTSARNRNGVYIDWGLGNTEYELIANNVYKKYLEKYSAIPLADHVLIDKIQELFYQEEMKQVEILKLWKQEYGM